LLSVTTLKVGTLALLAYTGRLRHPRSQKNQSCNRLSPVQGVAPGDSFAIPEPTTALQIHEHLTKILEAGHAIAERPISAALVESILTNDHSAWVASITRHGYDVRSLSDFLNIKQTEVKQLFAGQLDPMREQELGEQLKVAGLPVR